MTASLTAILAHQQALYACNACPQMIGPVVTGEPVAASILLVGQAPGDREGALGRPFAWTAGKTLFRWFEGIGVAEAAFRRQVYMAAVCRCFPGKLPKGGDRVPDSDEIARCRGWLEAEIALLRPRLILPVGKLAITQFIACERLVDVIGQGFRVAPGPPDHQCDLIPLPHPSGASTWHRRSPGRELLDEALARIAAHPAWTALRQGD